jgi:hypothetical protein
VLAARVEARDFGGHVTGNPRQSSIATERSLPSARTAYAHAAWLVPSRPHDGHSVRRSTAHAGKRVFPNRYCVTGSVSAPRAEHGGGVSNPTALPWVNADL